MRWPLFGCLASEVLAGAAGPHPERLRPSFRATAVSKPAPAVVYAEPGQALSSDAGAAAAELLRFVTAYRTGLEALVDVTPYAPLLDAAADAAGDLHFYAFIDTWVGNSSGWDVLYMDNETGVCYPRRRSHGNGWSVSLDLKLWPSAGGADRPAAKPRASVTLGSGYFGGRYTAGDIDLHVGTLVEADPPSLELSALVDLMANGTGDGLALVAPPRIFRCEHGADEVKHAALLGDTSVSAQKLERKKRDGEDQTADRRDLITNTVQTLAWPYMRLVDVQEVEEENFTVVAVYNASEMTIQPGMPVYLNPADVLTDQDLGGGLWWNISYPFEPAGEVIAAANGTMTLEMRHPCLPGNTTKNLPRLLVPAGPNVLPEAEALAAGAVQHGIQAAADGVALPNEPLLLEPVGGWGRWYGAVAVPATTPHNSTEPEVLQQLPVLARVLEPSAEAATGMTNSTVCVVTQRRQGRLFQRSFELPELEPGDRVLMQLAVTGHGWSSTSLQCGEFCHAVYRISLNGASAANVTQWRDDCHENPIDGSKQHGTWSISRNGWCPGTVDPGMYFDVTDRVRAGINELTFDVVVWSDAVGGYEAYSDVSGFTHPEDASFPVGMTALVYSGGVVAAVRGQGGAKSAAELALREGCSVPEALRPPDRVERHRRLAELPEETPSQVAASVADTAAQRHVLPQFRRRLDEAVGFDFEARAPWYVYNESAEGPAGGAKTVQILDHALVQAATRVVRAKVPRSLLAGDWAQAALLLRLSKPPDGLEYDHWDRVGSVGLELAMGAQDAKVRILPSTAVESASWHVARTPS